MTSWQETSRQKFLDPRTIKDAVEKLKAQNKTIATINGSFDLLHAGHLYMLFEASKVADVLIVAVNSDASIQQYKGADRPIISLEHRMEMLSALQFVDYVTWFEQTDPRQILKEIEPDVHVNGAEYGTDCIEAEVVKKLHLVDRIEGLATSQIIEKIEGLHALTL